jgi:hypothetical protein
MFESPCNPTQFAGCLVKPGDDGIKSYLIGGAYWMPPALQS